MPVSDQPWYINGVANVTTELSPSLLLRLLHEVEDKFGRVRRVRNEARVIDLDLLAYNDSVSAASDVPVLPHPRLQERAFVVLPLLEIAPEWQHPVTGVTGRDLLTGLRPGQVTELDE